MSKIDPKQISDKAWDELDSLKAWCLEEVMRIGGELDEKQAKWLEDYRRSHK